MRGGTGGVRYIATDEIDEMREHAASLKERLDAINGELEFEVCRQNQLLGAFVAGLLLRLACTHIVEKRVTPTCQLAFVALIDTDSSMQDSVERALHAHSAMPPDKVVELKRTRTDEEKQQILSKVILLHQRERPAHPKYYAHVCPGLAVQMW